MSVRIRKGYQAEIASRGWGSTLLFAETLEDLDREVESYLTRVQAVKESRTAAILARLAGQQRALYKAARAALSGEL